MMRNSIIFFLLGTFFFILFVLFSYLVHENLFTQLDFDTTVRLQDSLSRRIDPFFSWFSFFGNFEVMLILLCVLLFAFKRIIGGVITFFLFGLFHIIEIFGKWTVEHPPPPQFMLRTEHQVSFPQFHVRSEFSYPSGHSGRTVFLCTVLLYFIWKSRLPLTVKIILIGILIGYMTIMLVSRVYLGEHWATDVFGGALLGLSLGLISIMSLQWSIKKEKNKVKLSPIT